MACEVAAVMVNWNSYKDTARSVESLHRVDGSLQEVVVVDNSSDGSGLKLARDFPDITLLQNRENLGFALAANRGIEYALCREYFAIWLINNDTVVERSALTPLIAALTDDDSLAAAHSQVLYEGTGQPWYVGGKLSLFRGRTYTPKTSSHQARILHVSFVSGCSVLLRASALQHVGLFDPAYFLYFEDADWSHRALLAGYRLAYVPASVVCHAARASGFRERAHHVDFHEMRSGLIFIFANGRKRYLPLSLPHFAYRIARKTARVLIHERDRIGHLQAALGGLKAGMRFVWQQEVQRRRRPPL